MKIQPIIPIWLMAIICVAMLVCKRKGVWNFIRQILIVALIFTMNLRIMVHSYDVPKEEINLDVLFVIDDSMSMLAEDYDGDGRRIDAVKEDCEYIMDKLQGARFSVISFGNYAYRLAPYTEDVNVVMSAINSLEGQTQYYASGTSLNMPYKTMKEALEKADKNNPDRAQVVFFFSDGEITNEDEKLESYKKLKQYIVSGAVLGYGTEKGGKMLVRTYDGDYADPFYMQTRNKNGDLVDAISKIDEENLKSIAKDLGLQYYHMEKSSSIRETLNDISDYLEEFSTTGKTETEGFADTYYYFAIPLAALLVYDLIYYKRRSRT